MSQGHLRDINIPSAHVSTKEKEGEETYMFFE